MRFYKSYHAEHGKPPSVKRAWTEIEGLTKRNFYNIFKGGQAEACRLSGIPKPEDRIKATAKAREEKDKPPETPALLEEETKANEAEAALEVERKKKAALERVRKADAERLELEAMEDPKKIIPYLRSLEPELVVPFFDLCKESSLSPRRAWNEAVKARGENWAEWGRALKADGEDPHLKAYVADVIEGFVPKKRLELALEHHKEEWYTCKCSECGLPFEYEEEKGRTSFSCPDGHHQHHGGLTSIYPCPVCKELGRRSFLAYDRSQNTLRCKVCGFEGEVQSGPLNSKGTKAGVFKPQIAELAEKVKSLKGKLSEVQRQINAGERRVQVLERKRQQDEISLAKLMEKRKREDRELDAVRDEKAEEKRLRDSLKRESKDIKRKREVYNAMAEFLMDPKIITGERLANVVITLSAALKMRGQQGHVGESMKMTVEIRDKLLKRIAGGSYVLKDESEKRLGQELAKQQRKHERKLKAKDSQIDAEGKKREEVELRLGEAMKIVNSPMLRGIRGLLVQSLDEERIIATS